MKNLKVEYYGGPLDGTVNYVHAPPPLVHLEDTYRYHCFRVSDRIYRYIYETTEG